MSEQQPANTESPHLAHQHLSPEEFARLSGLSLPTIRRYLAAGKLPKFQPGGDRCRIGIPIAALQNLDPAPSEADSDEKAEKSEKPTKSAPLAGPRRYGPRPRWQTQRNKKL